MPQALEKMICPFLDTDTWQPGFSGLYWLNVLSISDRVSAHDWATQIWLVSNTMKMMGGRRMNILFVLFIWCFFGWVRRWKNYKIITVLSQRLENVLK